MPVVRQKLLIPSNATSSRFALLTCTSAVATVGVCRWSRIPTLMQVSLHGQVTRLSSRAIPAKHVARRPAQFTPLLMAWHPVSRLRLCITLFVYRSRCVYFFACVSLVSVFMHVCLCIFVLFFACVRLCVCVLHMSILRLKQLLRVVLSRVTLECGIWPKHAKSGRTSNNDTILIKKYCLL